MSDSDHQFVNLVEHRRYVSTTWVTGPLKKTQDSISCFHHKAVNRMERPNRELLLDTGKTELSILRGSCCVPDYIASQPTGGGMPVSPRSEVE
jgi:hypothetical protein